MDLNSEEKGNFMENRKGYAIVCWGISAVTFLAALMVSDGKMENLTKQVIALFIMAIIWLILGITHWIKQNA